LIATLIDVVVFKRHKICKIGEIVRYLPDKKFRLPFKLSLLRGSRPKFAPNNCTQTAPDFIQISPLSVELWPNA